MRERPLWLLFGVAAVLLFWKLGSGSLENSDGSLFAVYARNQLTTGNYLDLDWFGGLELLKPPGFIWMLSLSSGLLGDAELAYRLPAALACLILIMAAAGCAGRLFDDPERSRRAALVAGAALLASGLIYFNARRVRADVPLALFITVGIWALLRLKHSPLYLLLWGGASGLAMMTKGAVALPPVAAGLVYLVIYHRRSPGWPHRVGAAAVFLAVALPWHVVQSIRHPGFLGDYIGLSLLSRMGRALPGLGSDDPWLYLEGLWHFENLLGVAFLGAGLAVAALTASRMSRREPKAGGLLLVSLCWLLLALPLQVSSTRLVHYLVPVLPPLAISLGYLVALIPVRRLVFAGVLVVLGLLFMLNNLTWLVDLERSPGVKSLAPAAVEGVERIYTYNLYHPAAVFYTRRRVELLTDQARGFEKVAAWPIFRDSGTVRLMDEPTLAAAVGRAGTAVFTGEPHLPHLLVLLERQGIEPEVMRHGATALVLVR